MLIKLSSLAVQHFSEFLIDEADNLLNEVSAFFITQQPLLFTPFLTRD